MKKITTSKICNTTFRGTELQWKHDSGLTTILKPPYVILKTVAAGDLQGILLPIKQWESLVVFLAESFATAELQEAGKTGEIGITLTIDRKIIS